MKAIVSLCKSYGFVLERCRNHLVFIGPNGQRLTTSKTAGDQRALRNIERDIKRLLGTKRFTS